MDSKRLTYEMQLILKPARSLLHLHGLEETGPRSLIPTKLFSIPYFLSTVLFNISILYPAGPICAHIQSPSV